jgi:hypothetical protein
MRPALLLLASLFWLTTSAQRIALGLKGGLMISGTKAIHISTTAVPGAVAGLYMPYHAGPRLELQPELLVGFLGAAYQQPDADRYVARTLYIQVPLSAKFFLNNEINLQGGVQGGKLLMAYHETADGPVTTTERYNNLDFGLNGGIGIDLRSGLDLTLRYYSGMSPVLRHDEVLFPRNRTLQFTAGYRLMRLRTVKAIRRRS